MLCWLLFRRESLSTSVCELNEDTVLLGGPPLMTVAPKPSTCAWKQGDLMRCTGAARALPDLVSQDASRQSVCECNFSQRFLTYLRASGAGKQPARSSCQLGAVASSCRWQTARAPESTRIPGLHASQTLKLQRSLKASSHQGRGS